MIEKVCEIIKNIKEVRDYAIKNNLLDEQWFLDFLDKINELSLDPDRK